MQKQVSKIFSGWKELVGSFVKLDADAMGENGGGECGGGGRGRRSRGILKRA